MKRIPTSWFENTFRDLNLQLVRNIKGYHESVPNLRHLGRKKVMKEVWKFKINYFPYDSLFLLPSIEIFNGKILEEKKFILFVPFVQQTELGGVAAFFNLVFKLFILFPYLFQSSPNWDSSKRWILYVFDHIKILRRPKLVVKTTISE